MKTQQGRDQPTLNAEEIGKLKSFLRTLQGDCSLAQVGMCLNSESFNTSYTTRNNLWVLDSGVIDQMTPNLKFFETFEPISSSKKITVANG